VGAHVDVVRVVVGERWMLKEVLTLNDDLERLACTEERAARENDRLAIRSRA
jgi:hypothetical protein